MKHILLIEDNVIMSENTAEILELNGYRVSVAFNGKEGVKKASSLEPDLILCDVMMPEMDGFGVAYTLKQNEETRNIPLVFLTAKAEKADIRKGMSLGADDYLTKPYSSLELLTAIETRLKKSNAIFKRKTSSTFLEYEDGELLKNLKILIDSEGIKAKRYQKKEIVFAEDATPSQIYFIKSGLIKVCKSVSGGKDLISYFLSSNQLVGLSEMLLNKPFVNYAIALDDTYVFPIKKQAILSMLVKNPSLHLNIQNGLLSKSRYLETRLAFNSFKSVKKRIAMALLELKELYLNSVGKDFIVISREDLANFVGVSSETAIRTLSELKNKGFISIESGRIEILDAEALKSIRK